jgi:hypothetical protein
MRETNAGSQTNPFIQVRKAWEKENVGENYRAKEGLFNRLAFDYDATRPIGKMAPKAIRPRILCQLFQALGTKSVLIGVLISPFLKQLQKGSHHGQCPLC